jgi:GMP synthase (glutamine-hydrolysing)
MVRIYVIDNGGQWTHREWRTLRYLNVDTKIIPNTTPYSQLKHENIDGLILSGGAPRVGIRDQLGNCAEYLEKTTVPILGICAGHQYMARYFNGDAAPSKTPEFGRVILNLLDTIDPLFSKVPSASIVWESHHDEVTKLPPKFTRLAESKNCPIQAMRHTNKPLYGVQFHPEVEHTEFGEQIFKNFIKICEEHK